MPGTTRWTSWRLGGRTALGRGDLRDVVESDAIFAVVNGVPPDEGVMVELGIAIALGKHTFLFRDDFRRVVESEQYPSEPDAVHRPAGSAAGGTTTTRPSAR